MNLKRSVRATRRIHELAAEGRTHREIATLLAEEKLGRLTHTAVGDVLRKAKGKKPASAPTKATKAPATKAPAADASQLAALLAAPLPDDATPLDFVREQFREARALVTLLAPSVGDQSFPAQGWAALVTLTMKLQEHITEQERRSPIKPENDPSNQKLADALLAEITSRVESAEVARGGMCPACMRGRPAA